jgi:DNA invertase Pin-like site-specific DNA recombinase
MEREATGERTKEAINHIRKSGYHFGKVPFGKRTIPAPDHPRMKILVDDEEESAVIAQIRSGRDGGSRNQEMANRLNAKGPSRRRGRGGPRA